MINVFGASHDKESILKSISESIDSSWLGCGKKVEEFESVFSQKIRKPFVMTNNGSNALHLAVKLLCLPVGSKVILPSFTFTACIQAILLERLTPVLCDVELDGNISARTIKEVLSDEVKAIMVVHYAGRTVEMDEILNFGLPIIEDAAHAVNSEYKGQPCGSMGEIGCFSFDPIKNISTPDSGGVCLKNADQALKLRNLAIPSTGFYSTHKNEWWEQEVTDVFSKYQPNDIAAIFALSQLNLLEQNQKRRKEIWEAYQTEFSSEPPIPSYSKHSYFTYLFRTNRRNELAQHLLNKEIYTTFRFPLIQNSQLFLKYATPSPNAQTLNSCGLNLPLHPAMTDNDIGYVISAIKGF